MLQSPQPPPVPSPLAESPHSHYYPFMREGCIVTLSVNHIAKFTFKADEQLLADPLGTPLFGGNSRPRTWSSPATPATPTPPVSLVTSNMIYFGLTW